jgi:hypothetical protein
MGLDFIRPIRLASRYSGNQYILIAIDYASKSVKVKVLRANKLLLLQSSYMTVFPLDLAVHLLL